jgi:hypothetical protein
MKKSLSILFLHLLLLSIGVQKIVGQEFIRNGGFEQTLNPAIEVKGFDSLDAVLDWYNANLTRDGKIYGTPDHLYLTYDTGFNRQRYTFQSFLGSGALGLITYMQRLKNYREIAFSPLINPLIPNEEYVLHFFVSRGAKKWFGSMGTTSFQIYLSKEIPVQSGHEPLKGDQLIYNIDQVKHWAGWNEIKVKFRADDAYRYVILGSGKTDEMIEKLPYYYDNDPQEYLFIDEVSIRPHKSENDQDIQEISLLDTKEKRALDIQDYCNCKPGLIRLSVSDEGTVDGDQISLYLGQQKILEKTSLKRKANTLKILAKPGAYTLSMYAHNTGLIPPNTAFLKLKCGRFKKEIRLKSTLNTSGAIRLIVKD